VLGFPLTPLSFPSHLFGVTVTTPPILGPKHFPRRSPFLPFCVPPHIVGFHIYFVFSLMTLGLPSLKEIQLLFPPPAAPRLKTMFLPFIFVRDFRRDWNTCAPTLLRDIRSAAPFFPSPPSSHRSGQGMSRNVRKKQFSLCLRAPSQSWREILGLRPSFTPCWPSPLSVFFFFLWGLGSLFVQGPFLEVCALIRKRYLLKSVLSRVIVFHFFPVLCLSLLAFQKLSFFFRWLGPPAHL